MQTLREYIILFFAKVSTQPSLSKNGPHAFNFQRPTTNITTKVVPPEKDPSLIPAFSSDLLGASIAKPVSPVDLVAANNLSAGHTLRRDESSIDGFKESEQSLLIVGDSSGSLHFFLDGFYPLGHLYLGLGCSPISIHVPPLPPFNIITDPIPNAQLYIFATRRLASSNSNSNSDNNSNNNKNILGGTTLTNARAASLRFPLLYQQVTRDVARISTTIKELLVFSTSVTREMHDAWMGTESREGARGLGSKWLKYLENVQAAHGDGMSHFFRLSSPLNKNERTDELNIRVFFFSLRDVW